MGEPGGIAGAGSGDSHWIDRRMALAREWDDLVERVRGMDGFTDFLRPPPLHTLLQAAARGTVVAVNVSRWRCDALVVTTRGVRVVELPELTLNDLAVRTAAYLGALRGGGRADSSLPFAAAIHQQAVAQQEREDTLRSTTEWLWDVVASPVLDALGYAGPVERGQRWPRLWWCPTGLLTLLPLHGAGYHAAGDGRTVLDRVVSSYTPTIRALSQALKPSPAVSAGADRLLFVGVPDLPDQLHLIEEVAREGRLLRALFPEGLTVIEGPEATVAAVHAALGMHRWVHFSCHGHQDLDNPSAAGLMLSDGILSIPRISTLKNTGEFAFLSACRTATGGLSLPDEVITLAAALNYTCHRHVVGTLWSVDPAVAAEVSEKFYPQVMTAGALDAHRSAPALHQAVRSLRADGCPLADWLPFTHTGP